MLTMHSVSMPPYRTDLSVTSGQVDETATAVLKLLKPGLLDSYVPLSVFGDGNCMYRALSRAVYGTEKHHLLLRLFTGLEVANHDELYDRDQPGLADLIGDRRINSPSYQDMLTVVLKPGQSQELVHMFAASAVLQKPIVSHHPSSSDHFAAWTRRVVGRGVKDMPTDLRLLWSSTKVPKSAATFTANHFVLLHPTAKPKEPTVINLADAEEFTAIPTIPRKTALSTAPSRTAGVMSTPQHGCGGSAEDIADCHSMDVATDVRTLYIPVTYMLCIHFFRSDGSYRM